MIEVILISVGFCVGFAVTTYSHKAGIKSISKVYESFMNPPLQSDDLETNTADTSSDSDKEPYPFYNFEDYENYVETNGLEYQHKEEEELIDEDKFEDLNNA